MGQLEIIKSIRRGKRNKFFLKEAMKASNRFLREAVKFPSLEML